MDTNVLYYGDNLDILRKYIPSDSVDLVYLDPPFNSNQSYSAIFADESGRKSDAQIHAFEDQWHWGPTAEAHLSFVKNSALHQGAIPPGVSHIVGALEFGIGKTPMLAYLVEMAVRLVELRRVLKPTGSLYLHCDPTASHYLRVVLDAIFDADRFLGEIIWKRTSAHSSANRPGPVHDTLLVYAKGTTHKWNPVYQPYDQTYLDAFYTHVDPDGRRWRRSDLTGAGTRNGETGLPWHGIDVTVKGRHWAYPPSTLDKMDAQGMVHWPAKDGGMPMFKRYADTMPGVPMQDVWTDIKPIHNLGEERLGYPTQKPVALLERIIEASSDPGDVILDPFCGCGTATVAAQKLGRKWIGIDVTYLAIAVMRRRLQDSFANLGTVPVIGQPTEVEGARQMATESPEGRYQFQWWALDMVGALPASGDQKKGADAGVDGRITFTGGDGSLQQAIVSVKSGKPKVDDVRVLKTVIQTQQAAIGILVTLDEPTKPMTLEATIAGTYHSDVSDKDYPRIQIISVTDLLEKGMRPTLPPLVSSPYQKAAKIAAKQGEQQPLFGVPEG